MEIQAEIEKLLGSAREYLPGIPAQIPIGLISNTNSTFLKSILAPVDPSTSSFKMQNQSYPIKFFEPLYIDKIEVVLDEVSDSQIKKLKINTIDALGKVKERTLKPNANGISADIKDIVVEIDLESVKKKYIEEMLSKDVRVKGVLITGYLKEEFEKISIDVQSALNIKETIDNTVAQQLANIKTENERLIKNKTEIDQQVSQKKEELKTATDSCNVSQSNLSDLKAEIEKLGIDRNGLSNEIQKLNDKYASLKQEELTTSNNIQKLISDGKDLVESNRILESQLRELKKEKSFFTEDIRGYVKRGSDDVGTYTILAFLPLVILVAVTYNLYHGAQEMLSFYTQFPKDDRPPIMDVLLSRLPYTLVSIVIIEVCFKICMNFVKKVVQLNRDRLNLSRVSILARDVSDSIFSGIDLHDDEIKFQLMAKLKMDLLKAHLSKDVGNEYAYDPDIHIPLVKRSIYNKIKEQLFGKDDDNDETK